MDNGNNFFKKNWLTLILIALLGGVSIMWIKDMNETKAKEEAAVEKADSGAVASQEAVDSLAGTIHLNHTIRAMLSTATERQPGVWNRIRAAAALSCSGCLADDSTIS